MFRPTSDIKKAAKRAALAIGTGTVVVSIYDTFVGQSPVVTISLGVGALIGIATLIAYYKPAK